ncbi:MAG TPA: lamin tail domain-containing protein [Thermomicrobiales bacterium]|nr:lamin tail domain-containing protein [Thermomicrobiales bacterium]
MYRVVIVATIFATVFAIIGATVVSAAPVATNYFYQTWARTDKPVADRAADRTWMWGPEAYSDAFLEPYAESPEGERLVQYYDKSRMEITHPGDDGSSWYVTNGLLVNELITGRMQVGDNQFEQRAPADINVIGDPDQDHPITYAMLGDFLDDPPREEGDRLWERLAFTEDGELTWYVDHEYGSQGMRAGHFVPETNHTVAEVFWEFMNSTGPRYYYSILFGSGGYDDGQLFENPFYATGFPITEAYWAFAEVGGVGRDVLLQCFERRCLTYTPENPVGWQVEAGNVGQHYFRWRYGDDASPTVAKDDIEITELWPGETFSKPGPVEEHITLRNGEEYSVDLTNWVLTDQQDNHRYTFSDISIGPGEKLTIYSCGGAGSGEPGTLDLGFCDGWWDWGDYATLYDPAGTLVAYRYQTSQ